jgi:hypothetical protein
MATIYGRCLDVRIDPPRYFVARIGLNAQSARWYSLPLDWDGVVTPSEAQIELDVLPATGWVERLRHAGPPPRDLRQLTLDVLIEASAVEPDAEDATAGTDDASEEAAALEEVGATQDERRAMRQFARHTSLGSRISAPSWHVLGWISVILGMLVMLAPFGVVGYLALAFPQELSRSLKGPDTISVIVLLLAIFVSLGLILVATGIFCLWGWRRYGRYDSEPAASVDGAVLAWMPYRDMWSPTDWQQRTETLISLRLPDAQTHVYRIPIRYLHRVRQRGAHVRITYAPTTERVRAVTRLDEPPGLEAAAPPR